MDERSATAPCPLCGESSQDLRVTYGAAPAGYVYCTTHGLQWLDTIENEQDEPRPG